MRNMVIKSLMFAAMSVSLMSCGGSAGSGNSEVSAERILLCQAVLKHVWSTISRFPG